MGVALRWLGVGLLAAVWALVAWPAVAEAPLGFTLGPACLVRWLFTDFCPQGQALDVAACGCGRKRVVWYGSRLGLPTPEVRACTTAAASTELGLRKAEDATGSWRTLHRLAASPTTVFDATTVGEAFGESELGTWQAYVRAVRGSQTTDWRFACAWEVFWLPGHRQ